MQFEFPEPSLGERFLASTRNDIEIQELSLELFDHAQDKLRKRNGSLPKSAVRLIIFTNRILTFVFELPKDV